MRKLRLEGLAFTKGTQITQLVHRWDEKSVNNPTKHDNSAKPSYRHVSGLSGTEFMKLDTRNCVADNIYPKSQWIATMVHGIV